jgi:hypothetical protein
MGLEEGPKKRRSGGGRQMGRCSEAMQEQHWSLVVEAGGPAGGSNRGLN